jgi:hypothetical protein
LYHLASALPWRVSRSTPRTKNRPWGPRCWPMPTRAATSASLPTLPKC